MPDPIRRPANPLLVSDRSRPARYRSPRPVGPDPGGPPEHSAA